MAIKNVINDRCGPDDDGRGLAGTQADQLNENFEQVAPITTTVTKTVGPGKDFTSFHDAMLWVEDHTTLGAGEIILILDGQSGSPYTHEVGVNANYYIHCNLTVKSEQTDGKFHTFITLPSTDDGNAGPTTFTVGRGGDFLLRDVTFEVTKNSYPYAASVRAVHVVDGGRFHFFSSTISYCLTAMEVDRGHILSSGIGSDETVEYCTNGFIVTGMESTLRVEGSTTYLTVGATTNELIVTKGGRAVQDDDGFSILTANIPQDQIQYDGSYFMFSQTANTLKA